VLLCPPAFKNRLFRERLGFAWAGIRTVLRRERSFRTQCAAALAAAAVPAVLGLGPAWTALVALAIGLVLALEMVNAALEYLIDHLHPQNRRGDQARQGRRRGRRSDRQRGEPRRGHPDAARLVD
jgi:diacylglycerol kinase (ATP)